MYNIKVDTTDVLMHWLENCGSEGSVKPSGGRYSDLHIFMGEMAADVGLSPIHTPHTTTTLTAFGERRPSSQERQPGALCSLTRASPLFPSDWL